MTRRARAVLAVACGAHFIHDGFSDILYVLLPVWAAEFGLSFAQVGLLKTLYTGGMAAFQVPASILAERRGEARLLVAGTAVTALGFLIAGLTGGFVALLACLVVAGLGSGCQHPLSSSLVAKAYENGPRRTALGTYNFSGDLGKVAVPAAVALAVPWLGWRGAVGVYGVVGLVAAAVILVLLARLGAGLRPAPSRTGAAPERGSGSGIRDVRAFTAISAIHVIDNSTRTGFLTFLPFLLIGKGATVQSVGLALMLVFIGGAVGKFACGTLADRVGVIRTVVVTELITGAGILLLLTLPLGACLVALPVLGVALNGTSSVLYGSVADLVSSEVRLRAAQRLGRHPAHAHRRRPRRAPHAALHAASPSAVRGRRAALGLGPARGRAAGGGRWASDHDTLSRLLALGSSQSGSCGSGLPLAGNGSPGPPAAPRRPAARLPWDAGDGHALGDGRSVFSLQPGECQAAVGVEADFGQGVAERSSGPVAGDSGYFAAGEDLADCQVSAVGLG